MGVRVNLDRKKGLSPVTELMNGPLSPTRARAVPAFVMRGVEVVNLAHVFAAVCW